MGLAGPTNAASKSVNVTDIGNGFRFGQTPHRIERIVEERISAEARAERARPLAEHGGDRKDTNGQGKNLTLTQRGESAEYLTARIARDRPDILARMKDGGFPSVRAAGVIPCAGAVRRRPCRDHERPTTDQPPTNHRPTTGRPGRGVARGGGDCARVQPGGADGLPGPP